MRSWLLVAAALASAQDLAEYDRAIRENPKDYLAFYKRATALLAVGKDVNALADLTNVLRLQASFAPAQYYKAATELRLGMSDRARRTAADCTDKRCAEVIAQAKLYDEALQAARAEQADGEYADCVESASQAIAITPKAVAPRRIRSECNFALGAVGTAFADMSEIVALAPNDAEAVSRLAKARYLLYNDRSEALQLLRRCLAYDSEARDCVAASKLLRGFDKELAQPMAKMKYSQFEKRVIAEVEALGLRKEDAEKGELLRTTRRDRCEALADSGQWQRAAVVCAKVQDADPHFAPAVLVQAQLMREQGDARGAFHLVSNLLHSGVHDRHLEELYHQLAAELQQRPVSSSTDYYKVLGVPKDADQRAIKKAYRALTKKYHPDKYRGGDMSEDEVMNKMQEINEAYEVLGDESRRRDYDAERAHGGTQAPHARGQSGHQQFQFQFQGNGFDNEQLLRFAQQFGGFGGPFAQFKF